MSEFNKIQHLLNKKFDYTLGNSGYPDTQSQEVSIFDTDKFSDRNEDIGINSSKENNNNSDLRDTKIEERNEAGKVISATYYDTDGKIYKIEEFSYNEEGKKSSVIIYNGNNKVTESSSYEYFQNGNLKDVSTTIYDEAGNKKEENLFSYYENGNTNVCDSKYYYENGNVKEESYQKYNEAGFKIILNYNSYDEEGNELYKKEVTYNDFGKELNFAEYENGIKTKTRVSTYYENGNLESENVTWFLNGDKHNYISIYNNEGYETSYTEYLNDRLETEKQSSYYPNGDIESERRKHYNEENIMDINNERRYIEGYIQTAYIQYDNEDNIAYTEEFEYNDDCDVTADTIYDSEHNIIQRTENEYQSGYKIASVTYNGNNEIKERSEYNYTKKGLIQTINTYGSNNNLIGKDEFLYDESGNPAHHYSVVYDEKGNEIFNFEYEYDEIWEFNDDIRDYEGDVTGIYKNNKDGEIGYTQQGMTGDCWLLSAINSISYSKSGQNLLNECITDNGNGEYSVYFKGVDSSVTITEEEIRYAREQAFTYSRGDDDMLLLELAFEAVVNKLQNGEIEIEGEHKRLTVNDANLSFFNPLDGGFFEDAIYLLTGNDAEVILYSDENSADKMNDILDKFEKNPEQYALTFAFLSENNDQNGIVTDINNEYVFTITPSTGHALSIKSVNGNNITIVDPNDSSKEQVISRDTFLKFVNDIEYYEFN